MKPVVGTVRPAWMSTVNFKPTQDSKLMSTWKHAQAMMHKLNECFEIAGHDLARFGLTYLRRGRRNTNQAVTPARSRW
jgi:hypothetical protein